MIAYLFTDVLSGLAAILYLVRDFCVEMAAVMHM
jgi:hypothetical protein